MKFGKEVPFIIVPKNSSLPIMKMSMHDCITSWGDKYGYGYPCWTHQGHDANPFYHYNEDIKWAEEKIGQKLVWNAYNDYKKVLDEFHKVWRDIADTIMANRDEQITMKFEYFKIVSNVDTSILTY